MAKISKVVKNNKRKKIVANYAERRLVLKKIVNDPASTIEQVDEAVVKLQKLPRNASPVRMHNRCKLTGRPRGYMRIFGLSRNMFRKMALEGKIPGVTKASW